MYRILLMIGALCLSLQSAMADDDKIDGHYQCQSGVTTALKALDRRWTPIPVEPLQFELHISKDGQIARIEKQDFDCHLMFFEILTCSTGIYHFSVNTSTGRFTYDKSYGFIRGEDPRGDAEMVTTSLGICRPLTES